MPSHPHKPHSSRTSSPHSSPADSRARPSDLDLPADDLESALARVSARPRWPFLLIIILGLGVGIYFLWSYFHRRSELVENAIPAALSSETLLGKPAEFRTRLDDCEQRVRSAYGHEAVLVLAQLAHLYQANGYYTQAAQIYPALIKLDPTNARWPFLQAVVLINSKRQDEALPFLEQARALDPARIPLRLQLADLLFKANRPVDASVIYRSVLADAPDNLYALLGLARIDMAAQSWTSALDNLRLVIATHPEYAEPQNLLATVYERLSRTADAADARNKAKTLFQLPPPPDDWLDTLVDDCYDAAQMRIAADTARATGNVAHALSLLNRTLSFAPDDALTHRYLGKMFSDQVTSAKGSSQIGTPGDRSTDTANQAFENARLHLARATALAPTDVDAWSYLIALYNKTGDTNNALTTASFALQSCPESGSIRYEYARALLAAGNLESALYQFQETRRLRPEETASLGIEIARICFRLNRPEEGAAELMNVLKADPGHPIALTSMVRLFISRSDAWSAQHYMSRARTEPRVPRSDIEELSRLYQRQFNQLPP